MCIIGQRPLIGNTPHQQIKTKNCLFRDKNRFAPAYPWRGVSVLSLAHSGGWTCECERRGAGMCPAWRQVHLTRPASCTPARDLQHSSQSLSKCAGATSTTISSAKSRFHNMRQVSPFMYACLPQKYEAQNRRTALASPHSHATCQPHRCQVRFCFQELQLPYKAKSMYSLS